ncbi:hypothetical protein D1872_324270 [compost metagenome]
MILLPDNENTAQHIAIFQRAEVESLERGIAVHGELLAKYERELADARERLARTERLLNDERERSI